MAAKGHELVRVSCKLPQVKVVLVGDKDSNLPGEALEEEGSKENVVLLICRAYTVKKKKKYTVKKDLQGIAPAYLPAVLTAS